MYRSARSGLEYVVQNNDYISQPQAFYSMAGMPTQSYHDGMFIPSRDLTFFSSPQYKETKLRSYSSQQNYNLIIPKAEYHFIADNFLKPGKEGIFVGKADEVKEFVEEAFAEIFQRSFPNNIRICILNRQEFSKIAPSPGTVGLSINRGQQGLLSEIFILNDNLGRVMLTIGHELGHVLTHTLSNPHDEEAKAYAFSLLWIKKIQQHNIADLGEAIVTERPAENDLHNIAFHFVHDLMMQGKEAEEIYQQLIKMELSLH